MNKIPPTGLKDGHERRPRNSPQLPMRIEYKIKNKNVTKCKKTYPS